MELICKILRFSRSSYYDWKRNRTYQPKQKEQVMKETVEAVFHHNKRRYGARRIAKELCKQHKPISLYKARRIMAVSGLKAIQSRSFVPRTTDSWHSYPISPNLLESPAKLVPCGHFKLTP